MLSDCQCDYRNELQDSLEHLEAQLVEALSTNKALQQDKVSSNAASTPSSLMHSCCMFKAQINLAALTQHFHHISAACKPLTKICHQHCYPWCCSCACM